MRASAQISLLRSFKQAIERLEYSIKAPYPAIQHVVLESGALKSLSRSARHAAAAYANGRPAA